MDNDRTPAPLPLIEAATAAPFGRGRAARHTARSPAGFRFRPVRLLPVFLTLRRCALAGRADEAERMEARAKAIRAKFE